MLNKHNLSSFSWRYMKTRKRYIVLMLAVATSWCAIMAAKPFLLKNIIDSISKTELVLRFCMAYIGLLGLDILVTNVYLYANSRLYPKIRAEVIQDMHQYLLKHSYEYFQNNFAGTLSRKITDLSLHIEPLIQMPNDIFLVGALRIIMASAVMLYAVPKIFSITLFAWSILFISITFVLAKSSEKYASEYAQSDTDVGGALSDSITNIISIKLFSAIKSEFGKLNEKLNIFINNSRALELNTVKINTAQGIILVVLFVVLFGLLLHYSEQEKITAGDFALVVMLANSLVEGIYMLGRQIIDYARIRGLNDPHEFITLSQSE